jgi:RNA polymerase sigma factor CnrH
MTAAAEQPDDPDLELVRALQRGEDDALGELMERHQDALFRFIGGHVFNDADAAELAQETFIRAYFKIGQFRPEAKFASWLYRIALNLCRDHARSRRAGELARTDSLSQDGSDAGRPERDLPAATGTPADSVLTSEKLAALEEGMAQLPAEMREALVLTALERRSHKESAELLGTTPKTVELRVYRARKRLAEWMEKAGF